MIEKNLSWWQKQKKEKKIRKNLFVALFWILFLFFLLFLGVSFKFFRIVKESRWDGNEKINFVFEKENPVLVFFDPQRRNLTLVLVPGQMIIKVNHGYGRYKVKAVKELEELEKRKGLLAESIQEEFAVFLAGWIKERNYSCQIENQKEEILCEIKKQFLGQKETNFSRFDLLRLWWGIRRIKKFDEEVIDLSKRGIFSQGEFPDGTKFLEMDIRQADALIQKYANDPLFKKEKLLIEVLNGTSYPGLAERGARFLTNIGGEVVSVGNAEGESEECEVRSGGENKNSYTVKKIIEIFNCRWVEKKEEGRAEITLILGKDYWQKLNQK